MEYGHKNSVGEDMVANVVRHLSNLVLGVRVRWLVVLLSLGLALIDWVIQQKTSSASAPIFLGFLPTMIAGLLLLASKHICHARNQWIRLGQLLMVIVYDTIIIAIGAVGIALSTKTLEQSWAIVLSVLPIFFFLFPLLVDLRGIRKREADFESESKLD